MRIKNIGGLRPMVFSYKKQGKKQQIMALLMLGSRRVSKQSLSLGGSIFVVIMCISPIIFLAHHSFSCYDNNYLKVQLIAPQLPYQAFCLVLFGAYRHTIPAK
ncbi:MAG: hypothetical protein IJ711_08295 [Lachnospiraceae bacterium]|nr:hypothetical protein [Lachnospiraceae bacterium]